MKKFLIFITSLVFTANYLNAQFAQELDPSFNSELNTQGSQDELEVFMNYHRIHRQQKTASSYIIPTVVHVIHNNGAENITDSEITAALDMLNNRFNGDYGGIDTDIEFRLAKIDPDGNCTSGITRTQYDKPYVTDGAPAPNYVTPQEIRDLVTWPQNKYLNIWIVRNVKGWRNYTNGTSHFVNVASVCSRRGSPQWTQAKDGIIIQYSNFGQGTFHGMNADAMMAGITGRYLNLINVWGGGSNVTGCCRPDEENSQNWVTTDLINDTPPCNFYGNNFTYAGFDDYIQYVANCSPEMNCDNGQYCIPPIPNPTNNFPKENYMSYNFGCMNQFTSGQKNWMQSSIDFFRSNLVSTPNLYATGVLEEIYADTEWNSSDFVNGNVYLQQSITIPSGVELTINSGVTVHFDRNAKLIIEKGGKVTINGARLTNFCDLLWEGIEVQGDAQMDQYPYSNQGYLRINSGTIIENAECAIRVAKNNSVDSWNIDWSKTGGVVKATGCTFRNNIQDVEFLSYHNINDNTNNLANNLSSFTSCTFTVVQQLSDNSSALKERVHLFDVEGILFRKCKFSVEGPALNYYTSGNRGYGIRASEAGFSVSGSCAVSIFGQECEPTDLTAQLLDDPNSDFIPSTFRNFKIGIKATSSTGGAPIKVTSTLFDDNVIGSQLVNMESAVFRRNKFLLPQGAATYGAQFNGCSQYTIERNVFETNVVNVITVGLNIINSGPLAHEVYLNDFTGLFAGVIVQQQNQDHSNGNDSDIGLELLCNDFAGTDFDMALTNNASIANLQGAYPTGIDVTAPAGNIFASNGPGTEKDWFVSNDSEWFVYIHHDPDKLNVPFVRPESIDPQEVINASQNGVYYTTRQAVCPTSTNGTISSGSKNSNLIERREIVQRLKAELHAKVDGGNTEELLNFIRNTHRSEEEISSRLSDLSPYLSNAVLKAVVQGETSLTSTEVHNVLMKNSPLDSEVWKIYEKEQPLPTSLNESLLAFEAAPSSHDIERSQVKQQNKLLENDMRRYIESISFSEGKEVNELKKELFNDLADGRRIRALVTMSLQEGNYEQAKELVSEYTPTDANDNFKEFASQLLEIKRHQVFDELSQAQIEAIRSIAQGDGTMKISAACLLEQITGEILYPDVVLPTLEDQQVERSLQTSSNKLITVYPNPVEDYTVVSFELPNKSEKASIELHDLEGRLIKTYPITDKMRTLQIDMKDLHNGGYLVTLIQNGTKISQEKIIVSK